MDEMKTTEAQRGAQVVYAKKQLDRGYYQTRPWLPLELREWHEIFVRRAREWKMYGTEFVLPPLPDLPTKK